MSKAEALKYLQQEDIIKPNHTSFWIQFEDGSQIELTEVLKAYAEQEAAKGIEKSIEKLQSEFKARVAIWQSIQDGWGVGIYDNQSGELIRQEIGATIESCLNKLKQNQ